MCDRAVNKSPCKVKEQGVTSASLQLTSPRDSLRSRRGKASRVEEDGAGEARRLHCVSMRLNAEELAQLQIDAGARHQRMGALLRSGYFGGQALHVPAANVEKWRALAGALAALQRLAFKVNAGQLPIDVRPALALAIEQVHQLRADLIGWRPTGKGETDDER